MGRLDHVHIRVPDRAEAAAWYADHLGFEPVAAYDFWATGFEGGPLQISADGGQTTLALFEVSDGHPMVRQQTGVAFSVDADVFAAFARALPREIASPLGRPLEVDDLVDYDLCWAYDLVDPWGNQYELNCYDYDRVRTELVEPDGITPQRYWPPELVDEYRRSPPTTGNIVVGGTLSTSDDTVASSPLEVVRRIYEALDARDLDTVVALTSPDIVVVQDPALPWGGRYVGHDGLGQFFLALAGAIDSRVTHGALYEAGDRVVQYGRTAGSVRASGMTFDIPECHLWEVVDGLAVSATFFIDSSAMLAALAPPP